MAPDYVGYLIIAFVCIGILMIISAFYDSYRRRRKLRNLGLSLGEESSENDVLQGVGGTLSNLLAASEDDIADKFTAAGFYNNRFAYLFLPLKYTLLVFGLVVSALVFFYTDVATKRVALTCLFWVIAVIILPDAYLSIRAKKIQHKISSQLPYLLDLMAVCVQTGMTIESTMSYLAIEMVGFDRDLAHMLKKTNDRARIVGLEQALDELYERIPTAEIRSFVMTLNQSLQYGSSIYQVLTTLALDIREVQMLSLEEKVGKLSAKMSAPLVLFIMFPIIILIIAPGVMRLM